MNIYLELLFLNGYVLHPDHVVGPASPPDPGAVPEAAAQRAPCVDARIADPAPVSEDCA